MGIIRTAFPKGVPVTAEMRARLPADVQAAWKVFNRWWKAWEGEKKYSDMPAEVRVAFERMKGAPIPGMLGKTLADSCYFHIVESALR